MLFSHSGIALFDSSIDPIREALAQDDTEAVDSVLPRPLHDLFHGREVQLRLRILRREVQHFLDLERLVERHREMLYGFSFYDLKETRN